MTFDERFHLANTLQVSAWVSLLLLLFVGPFAFVVWAVLSFSSLAVRPSLPETFERVGDDRDLRRRLEADMRAAAAADRERGRR